MVDEKIIQLLDEVRKERGIGYFEISDKTGYSPVVIANFFNRKTRKSEGFVSEIAKAVGLRCDECGGCAAAIIDYYKNQRYFTQQEKIFLYQVRRLSKQKREAVEAVVALMQEE